jgi:hypothetical protein
MALLESKEARALAAEAAHAECDVILEEEVAFANFWRKEHNAALADAAHLRALLREASWELHKAQYGSDGKLFRACGATLGQSIDTCPQCATMREAVGQ